MKTPLFKHRAFSLVEVTLALGVAGFCLLAVFGLLPVGINSNTATVQQTAAVSIAQAVVADLRNTAITSPPTRQFSPVFKLTVPSVQSEVVSPSPTLFFTDGGQPVGVENADADPAQNPQFRVTLSYVPPTANSVKTATMVRLLVTWPALADPRHASAPANFSGSYEITTALDRN